MSAFPTKYLLYGAYLQAFLYFTVDCDINPLETKVSLFYIKRISSYRAVNTVHFDCKNRSLNYV
jgi:hypothetical protein